jgi:hypothetical protein
MQNTCRLTDPLGTGGLFHDGSLLNGNEGKGANVSGNSQSKAIQPNKGFDIYAGPPWQIARTGSATNDQGSHHFRSRTQVNKSKWKQTVLPACAPDWGQLGHITKKGDEPVETIVYPNAA